MKNSEIAEKIKNLLDKDSRYSLRAYLFVNECLAFAVTRAGAKRHVSGAELLDALRVLALKRYGNLSRLVLENWGIFSSEDVGEIVFNLVEESILSRQEDDSKLDFAGVLNFSTAFDDAEVKWKS